MNSLKFFDEYLLLKIFEYLSLDDVKSCRLVNRFWYHTCNNDTITRRETLVFRSHVCSTQEINDVLADFKHVRLLNVEFVGVQLKELNFEDFGSKIRRLTITNCLAESVEIVRNMLVLTPNTRYLHFSRYNDLPNGTWDDVLLQVFNAVSRDGCFQNYHLETIEYNGLLGSEIGKLFPRLKRIHGNAPSPLDFAAYFRCESQIEDMDEIYIDFDACMWKHVSPSLPRLKTLEATFNVSLATADSLNACLRFFAHQTDLERLTLLVALVKLPLGYEVELTERAARALLFHISRNCNKLRQINLRIYADVDIDSHLLHPVTISNLRKHEFPELINLASKVDELNIIEVTGETSTFEKAVRNHLHPRRLKVMRITELLSGPDDLRRVILEHQSGIEVLELSLHVVNLCMDDAEYEQPDTNFYLDRIIESQKNLRSLKVILWGEDDLNSENVDMIIQRFQRPVIHHEKLEHFELVFTTPEVHAIFNVIHLQQTAWNFPNLTSLELSYTILDKPYLRSQFSWLTYTIIALIKKLPTGLTEIKLPRQRYCYTNIHDIAEICKDKQRIRHLAWSSWGYPHAAAINTIFEYYCPTLKNATVHVYSLESMPEVIQYYYCRYQKKLYKTTMIVDQNSNYTASVFNLALL